MDLEPILELGYNFKGPFYKKSVHLSILSPRKHTKSSQLSPTRANMSTAFILSLIFFGQTIKAANILGVALHPSYSHQATYRPLWRELSLRGHQVTVLTTDPMRNSTLANLTEIDLSFAYDVWKASDIIESSIKGGLVENYLKVLRVSERVIEAEMASTDVVGLMNNDSLRFDLVIAEAFYLVGFGFAEKYDCPLVLALSVEAFGSIHYVVGNPNHVILYPNIMLPYDHPLSLKERIVLFLAYLAEDYIGRLVRGHYDLLLKQYFGPNVPKLVDLTITRTKLVLSNFNLALGTIRPYAPATVAFGGGTHIEPLKPLPESLQKFLDAAEEGVVYFSFGSHISSKDMTPEQKTVILETFSALPFQILWKSEEEGLLETPRNVYLYKWVPQQDVLRKRL